jgi:hypothetical protein
MHVPEGVALMPDHKFLRNTGALLVLLAIGAGAMTVIGTYAVAEAPLQISEATSLENGAEQILRETAGNVSERDVFTPSSISITSTDEGD